MNEMDVIDMCAKELKLAAVREQWGNLTFLRRLLEEEVARRRERSKISRIHRADFPEMKYLEELQRDELPMEGRMILPEVETLDFIRNGKDAHRHRAGHKGVSRGILRLLHLGATPAHNDKESKDREDLAQHGAPLRAL